MMKPEVDIDDKLCELEEIKQTCADPRNISMIPD